MSIKSKYVHTNIVARDWKRLARFYEEVFGCLPVPPERNLSGGWLERATGVAGARIRGTHLRLPGLGENGPTLEIFEYDQSEEEGRKAVNRPGIAHIAFSVDDVERARRAVIDAGGGEVGEMVTLELPGVGKMTFVYLTDPEGNILELQRLS